MKRFWRNVNRCRIPRYELGHNFRSNGHAVRRVLGSHPEASMKEKACMRKGWLPTEATRPGAHHRCAFRLATAELIRGSSHGRGVCAVDLVVAQIVEVFIE